MKSILKNIAGKMGYEIRSLKFIPRHFSEDQDTLKISFDHVIYKHMAERAGNTPFFFIQVGAFDGQDCDPLYKFIGPYSWSGILLEPQPAAFAKLQVLHGDNSKMNLINAAIARTESKTEFYILEGDDLPSWSKGMASFQIENIRKHRDIIPSIDQHIRRTEVDCVTFGSLLSRFSVKQLDLLQIDTEGFDAEVIYMFPFEILKPAIVHFESKHLGKTKLEGVLDHLIPMGYRVAYDGSEDMLVVLDRKTSPSR
jgi:FkbM family methyltransferase